MTTLPPLDMHAHVDVGIASSELDALEAVVFAVTRSLSEGRRAIRRADRTTVWGVGCHPGVGAAHEEFSLGAFRELIDHAAFAGELGLDGKGEVPLAQQRVTFRQALEVLADQARIMSVHSYAACREVLEDVEAARVTGVVLHWWLGDAELTRRAVELGCWFSVNQAQAASRRGVAGIPLDRVLTETDHPFGDRRGPRPRRPGAIQDVERSLGAEFGCSPDKVREQVWTNVRRLVESTDSYQRLPRAVRARLGAL